MSDRSPQRKASPRTYRLHPKPLPDTGEEIAAEAERLGIAQGRRVERMWQAYRGKGPGGLPGVARRGDTAPLCRSISGY